MIIQSSSCLMPNHLPGNLQSTYERVEMIPTPSGRVIILGINKQKGLTVWLSGHEGLSAWEKILFKVGDSTIPAILSLDFKQSADMSTLDMVMVANVDRGSGIVREVYYWWDIDLTGDSEYWTLLFSRAVPMKVTVPGSFLGARLSQRKTTPRSLVLYGTDDNAIPLAYWVEFDQGGREVNFVRLALPCPAMPTDPDTIRIVCGQLMLGSVLTEVYYLGVVHSPIGLGVYVASVPGYGSYKENLYPPPPYVGSMASSYGMQVMMDSSGESTLWLGVNLAGNQSRAILLYFTPDNIRTSSQGSYANKTFEDYILGPKGMFKILHTANGQTLAYELGLPQKQSVKEESIGVPGPMYLLQTLAPQSRIDVVSTLISSDVTAFTACECMDPDSKMTVRHLLLCHQTGGMELLELDPVSEMWQSTMLLDGDLKAVTETQSFTTRVVIKDDTFAPYCNTMVTIKPDYPMLAFVDGKAIHLSSVITHAISTNMSGEVTLVTIADTLATPTFTVEAYEMPAGEKIFMGFHPVEVLGDAAPVATLFIDPTAPAVEKLKAVKSGMDIKNAKGSNGQFVFPQGTDDKTYDDLFYGLQKYLEAYDSTQALQRNGKRWQATQRSSVVERTIFSLKAGRLHVQQQDTPAVIHFGEHRLETFAGEGDGSFLSFLSDILSYIWTEITDTVEVILDKLSDGFYRIAVWVGKKLISAVFELGIQVLVMIDWLFETVLKTAFEVMVNWLGYVFDWEDIRKNKVVFKQAYKLSFENISGLLGGAKSGIMETAQKIRDIIGAPPEFSEKAKAILGQKAGSGDTHIENETEFSSPGAQWGMDKMKAYYNEYNAAAILTTDDLINELVKIFSESYTELTVVFEAAKNYLATTDLRSKSFLEIFGDILKILVTAAVDVLEIVALKLADVIGILFNLLWQLMNTRIDIPVLTTLYEKYIEPGGTFTVIDCMSLLSSCVYTVGYKLMFNTNPFTTSQLERIGAANSMQAFYTAFSTPAFAEKRLYIVDAVLRLAGSISHAVYVVASGAYNYAYIFKFHTGVLSKKAMTNLLLVSASTYSFSLVTTLSLAIANTAQDPTVAGGLNIPVILLLSGPLFNDAANYYVMSLPDGNLFDPDKLTLIRKGLGTTRVICGGVSLCLTAASVALEAGSKPEPTPADSWTWLVAGPAIQNFSGSVVEISQVAEVFDLAAKKQLFIFQAIVSALRPTFGLIVGVTYAVNAYNDVDYPLPTAVGF